MSNITKLPNILVAQIAAGEVIESPAGVLKELLENSIDAGADKIEIFIKGAGFESLQVRDNGSGIHKDDLSLAVENFATSKIKNLDDLLHVSSLGFRGEALGSIRSVSRLTIESRYKESDGAYKITAEADMISKTEPSPLPEGTRVVVEDLFFNVPVRKEFASNERKIKTEFLDIITNYALAYPSISFEYSYEKTERVLFSKANSLSERIKDIFSEEFLSSLSPLYAEFEKGSVEGFVSNFGFYKSNGSFLRFFINNRSVKYNKLFGILKKAYGEMLPPGRFPIAFLFLNLNSLEVDVNVHPQKKEVRFKDENKILEFMFQSVGRAVEGKGPISMRRMYYPAKKTSSDKEETKKLELSIPLLLKEEKKETVQNNLQLESNLEKLKPKGASSNETFSEEQKSDNNLFLPPKAHARLFDTFLLCSSDEGIFLVDQHTAHERINYEKFINKLNQKQSVSQNLLHTVSLNLSPAEKALVKEYSALISSLGFELEDLGPAGFHLSQVPFYVKVNEEEKSFFAALGLIEEKGEVEAKELFDHMAKSLACRHSIKKGDTDSTENLRDLLEELAKCENPRRCPHGRPTMVSLSKEDIFGLFKRRV
ncbi:MAG: DNA mismatch repair endonuclease MutL [Spirochaetia bacterium]|nr:DNA mismatch repair endonuclease MutL [Spirochaetia bacterium]